MMKQLLALGFMLAVAVSVTGCKCCGTGSSCGSSPLVGAPPCSSCGTPGGPPAVVVPPPPGPMGPAGPPAGPYGASYSRNL